MWLPRIFFPLRNPPSRPSQLSETDGPFEYCYFATVALPGLRLPKNSPDPLPVYEFPEYNSIAYLTEDPDVHCLHMDRGAAIGTLIMTAFVGRTRFGRASRLWQRIEVALFGQEEAFQNRLERESRAARERRRKQFTSPGAHLIYRGTGELLESLSFERAWRIGNVGYGIDASDVGAYRDRHRHPLHVAATALSLVMAEAGCSPETRYLSDMVYLIGGDELTIYLKTVTFGAVGTVITTPADEATFHRATSLIPSLLGDRRTETALRLYIESQKRDISQLRAFVAAWAALELLINRLAKTTWDDWLSVLADESELPTWDRDLAGVTRDDYRLRDSFLAVACVLAIKEAQVDAETFSRANKKRGDFYHTMTGREEDLPTAEVQALFRTYLRLGAEYLAAK